MYIHFQYARAFISSLTVIAVGFAIALKSSAASAETPASSPPSITLTDAPLPILDWAILGPFTSQDGAAFETDYLAKIDPDVRSPGTSLRLSEAAGWQAVHLPKEEGIVDLNTLFGDTSRKLANAAAYAVTWIKAEKEMDAALLIRGDDELRIWLNGKEIFTKRGSRELGLYSDSIPLPLSAGKNLLLVKIVNIMGGWGFSSHLAVNDRQAATVVLKQSGSFLRSPLLPSGEALALFEPGVQIATPIKGVVSRFGSSEKLPVSFEKSLEVSPLPREKGLYQITINLEERDYTQSFYVGDLSTLTAEVKKRFEDAQYDAASMDGLRTYLQRAEIVANAASTSGDLPFWDQKVLLYKLDYKAVFAAQKFFETVSRVEKGQPAFKDVAGLSIGAFHSQIDGQILHYRIFVPSTYRRGTNRLPLVAIMHPGFTARRPFIGGAVIANQAEAELWSGIAEDLGIGILWEGYRSDITRDPIDIAHLEEVLEAVNQNYDIDPQRITLWGECGAAATACLAVMRNPERYAGLLLLNPAIQNHIPDELRAHPAFQEWIATRDPLRIMTYPLPINVAHDSPDEAHGPIRDTHALAEAAAKASRSIDFALNTPDWPMSQPSTIRSYLTWLAKQKLKQPRALTFRHELEGGPLANIFAEPFAVVTASSGPPEAREAAQKLGQTFVEKWKSIHFGECRVIEDRELTPEMEAKFNLVLVGGPETNLVWSNLAKRLPVSVTAEQTSVYGQVFTGNYAIQAWCPNPSAPGRKILLLGGLNSAHMAAMPIAFCIHGWFDYAVWKSDNGIPIPIDVQRYKADVTSEPKNKLTASP